MSSKNPRKGRGKKRSMYEAGEGKIIRLELSRQKKGGKSKVTPLLGTRCETWNSQQLKIASLCLRKTETQRSKAGEDVGSPSTRKREGSARGPLASSAHTLRYRAECLRPLQPACRPLPIMQSCPATGHLG